MAGVAGPEPVLLLLDRDRVRVPGMENGNGMYLDNDVVRDVAVAGMAGSGEPNLQIE